MASPAIRSRRETAARDDRLRRPATIVRRFAHTAASAVVAAVAPRRSAQSRIARRSRRRRARSHSCWGRRSTDRGASRSGIPLAHTRSSSPARARRHALDRATAAPEKRPASRLGGCRGAAISSPQERRCVPRAHGPADRRGTDVHANNCRPRGVASAARRHAAAPERRQLPGKFPARRDSGVRPHVD